MTPPSDFAHLETPLNEAPRFHVGKPDGRRDWAENGFKGRQVAFIALGQRLAPRVMVHHVPNEGKRNPLLARKSGIVGGVFDNAVAFRAPLTAYVEIKGYDKRGKPNTLSPVQIAWGNRQADLGWPVACFFCPYEAWDWLRGLGFPVAAGRIAA